MKVRKGLTEGSGFRNADCGLHVFIDTDSGNLERAARDGDKDNR